MALRELTQLGYIEALGVSHRLYRFDQRHPLAPPLSALFVAEDERFREILQCLTIRGRVGRCRSCYGFTEVSPGMKTGLEATLMSYSSMAPTTRT